MAKTIGTKPKTKEQINNESKERMRRLRSEQRMQLEDYGDLEGMT